MNMNLPQSIRLILFTVVVQPLTALALTPSEVFDKVKNSVLVVRALNGEGAVISQGSGVLLPTGKVATNCHVMENGAYFQVGRDQNFAPATFFSGDGDKDICLLQADKITGTPTQLGTAATLKVGEPVYAIGAPKGLELSLSDGIVSALRGSTPPLIQTTAAISPGSSGGGLFDSEGRLVGLTTLYIEDGQSLNFAMPVEWLNDVRPGKEITAKHRSQIDWLTRAAALEERKDWSKLLEWAGKWVAAAPKSADAWFFVGHANQRLNQLDEAISAYQRVLRIDSGEASAWFNMGKAFSDLKRYDDAISAYRQALRIDSEYASAWLNMGNAFSDLKRYDDAISAYRQALRVDPEDASAWGNLGNAFGDLKRYDDAISAYRQAIRIDSEHANNWNSLGSAYADLNRTNDAISAFRQALLIDPDNAMAWCNLGISYGKLDQHKDAITAYREALRIEPEYTKAWYNLGVTYARSGDTSAALLAAKSLRPLDSAKADKLFNMIVPR